MKDGELRRIKKAAGIEAVDLCEVAPAFAAVRHVKAAGSGAKAAVRAVYVARRGGDSLPAASGGHNDQAGFIAIFRGRRAADDLDGLNRVRRNLVGEDLALLVGFV